MKVCGLTRRALRVPIRPLPIRVSPSAFIRMSKRRASASTTQNPTLWGLASNRVPGFPSPATQTSEERSIPFPTSSCSLPGSERERSAIRGRDEDYFFFAGASPPSSSFLPFLTTSGSAAAVAAVPPVSAVVVSSARNEMTCEITASAGLSKRHGTRPAGCLRHGCSDRWRGQRRSLQTAQECRSGGTRFRFRE